MASSEIPTHLDPSALGTKQYWDDAYTSEISNHAENPEDEGIVWFEDSGAEEKILEYVGTLPLNGGGGEDGDGDGDGDLLQDETVRVLDLGTGNGHLLFAMQDEGWRAEMVGVDYSMKSVELARQIQRRRVEEVEEEGEKVEGSRRDIVFEEFDILAGVPGGWLGEGFDIVLDKGTFDAISLNHEVDENGRKGFEKYGRKVEGMLRRGGCLLVTSCNWTEEEVRKWFESPELAYYGKIRYASFTFGGVKGQTVSSVCFRRRDSNES